MAGRAGALAIGTALPDPAAEGLFRPADRLDVGFYRAAYPDLAHLDEDAARAHYAEHGRREGRAYAAGAARVALRALFPIDRPVLEIGPYANPFLRMPNVRYADIFSTEELRARAPAHGLRPEDCPTIHHHLARVPLASIQERFAAAFSSHCIEHQPDLVGHLNDVAQVLEPGGRYVLMIPDRRYCFDHFRPCSTLVDVVAAHVERRTRHDARTLLAHALLQTHNDAHRHWAGDHGAPELQANREAWRRAAQDALTHGPDYVDAHAWQFTAESFAALVAALHRFGWLRLVPESVHDTLANTQEFAAVLRRD